MTTLDRIHILKMEEESFFKHQHSHQVLPDLVCFMIYWPFIVPYLDRTAHFPFPSFNRSINDCVRILWSLSNSSIPQCRDSCIFCHASSSERKSLALALMNCETVRFTPLVTISPNQPRIRPRESPGVKGARARPTTNRIPPMASIEFEETMEIWGPILNLSSWMALSSMSSRNWSILGWCSQCWFPEIGFLWNKYTILNFFSFLNKGGERGMKIYYWLSLKIEVAFMHVQAHMLMKNSKPFASKIFEFRPRRQQTNCQQTHSQLACPSAISRCP